jgi:hypothetical protein
MTGTNMRAEQAFRRAAWVCAVLKGRTPSDMKRLILTARRREVDLLDDAEAEFLIDVLGLRAS